MIAQQTEGMLNASKTTAYVVPNDHILNVREFQ